jgi:carboxymethylenebutenolidase
MSNATQDDTLQHIVPQNVSISTQNGDVPALLFPGAGSGDDAVPGADPASGDSGSPTLSAIVMLHDIDGIDDVTQQAASRLAASGYTVVVPDLFASSGGPQDVEDETAMRDYVSTLSDTRVVQEALSAVNFVSGSQNAATARIGVIGWGMGGAYAMMTAAYNSNILVAVNVGGEISYPVLTAQKPGSPLNFVANLGGALLAAYPGNDPMFPEIEVERLGARLVEHDKRGEVKVYPDAPPRFWRDASLPQTQALWRRIEHFLDEYLREDEVEPGDSATHLSPQGIPDSGYPNEESRLHA